MWDLINLSDATPVATEVAGLKPKTWLLSSTNDEWLFKTHRPDSHESVAEVLASHLALCVEVPALKYKLAVRDGEHGCVSPLVAGIQPGKQLLASVEDNYRIEARYRNEDHTINLIADVLSRIAPSDGATTCTNAFGQFLGYLMFDAWIVNTDRHHENWGYVESPSGRKLAPSYDHGSAFAWRESDDKLLRRLETTDAGFSAEHFLSKSKSALYADDMNIGKRKLSLMEAAELASARCEREEVCAWIARFSDVNWGYVDAIVNDTPQQIMSDVRKRWVSQILRDNQARLLEVVKC